MINDDYRKASTSDHQDFQKHPECKLCKQTTFWWHPLAQHFTSLAKVARTFHDVLPRLAWIWTPQREKTLSENADLRYRIKNTDERWLKPNSIQISIHIQICNHMQSINPEIIDIHWLFSFRHGPWPNQPRPAWPGVGPNLAVPRFPSKKTKKLSICPVNRWWIILCLYYDYTMIILWLYYDYTLLEKMYPNITSNIM